MTARDTREKLARAYDRMMERIHEFWETMDDETMPKLEQSIIKARDKAVELDEVTREEAHEVAEYIRRDLHDMGHYLQDNRKELRDWFRFDVEIVEDRLLELIRSVADKTRLELAELAEHNYEASFWKTGEVTGPGTLKCTQCGQLMHFEKTVHIPPCPKCHGTTFMREG